MNFTVAKTYDEVLKAFSALKDAFFSFEGSIEAFAEKIYKNGICMVCSTDCTLGLIAFYANNKDSGTAYITSLLVNENQRGKGIASALVKKAEELSVSKGFTRMKLEVRKDNLPAISLYKKLGYVFDGEKTESLYMCKNIEVE